MTARTRIGPPLALLAVLALAGCSAAGAASTGASTDASTGASSDASSSDASTPASDQSTSPAAAADLPDPCTLLTAAEITAATGVPFDEGKPDAKLSTPERQICNWMATGSPTVMTQVLVTALTPDGWDQAKTGTAQVNPVHDETIAGADRAFATNEGSILAMDVHGRFVQLAYFTGTRTRCSRRPRSSPRRRPPGCREDGEQPLTWRPASPGARSASSTPASPSRCPDAPRVRWSARHTRD